MGNLRIFGALKVKMIVIKLIVIKLIIIKSFIVEVAASIQRQVNTTVTNDNNDNINNNDDDFYEIPEYCIAKPTRGGLNENICYVNFSDAYYH